MNRMNKVDAELGERVHEYLISQSVETPFIKTSIDTSSDIKIEEIKSHFTEIMTSIGLDINDDSLMDTPARVAKMFINEFFWGLNYNLFPKITTVENKMGYDEMVIEKNIKSMSVCEHHFVTIDGKCHIGYIPRKKVLGLSKLNRVVDFFSRRPQIQERLSEQIYHCLSYILETDNIAVVLEGTHYCVKSRGIEDQNSETITSKMGGIFREDMNIRQEFLRLIR